MPPKPAIYNIPAGHSFVEVLAQGLLDRYRDHPEALASAIILLPTRRAARTLREAFLRRSGGKALLLPRMAPLGDLDDDEPWVEAHFTLNADSLALAPAINPTERIFLLTRLVDAWRARDTAQTGEKHSVDQAYRLAVELARFLDIAQTEGLDLKELDAIVGEEFADHWQLTLDFMTIIRTSWPEILAERQVMDPADRRNATLKGLAEAWAADPPQTPIIAAGSTGSVPATAALLKTISTLPQGEVILPGFDQKADPQSWAALEPSHPQYGMKQLLERIGATRDDVAAWTDDAAKQSDRAALLGTAMCPSATVETWTNVTAAQIASGIEGLYRIDAPTQHAEAQAIALIMRETLETPGRTVALVTPDRHLARQTAAAMRRWGIELDDSAGTPLGQSPVGAFARQVAEMAAQQFAPVPLLSVLKHPLCALGAKPGHTRAAARLLETQVLRGPRPRAGLSGVTGAIAKDKTAQQLRQWWSGFHDICTPLAQQFAQQTVPLRVLLTHHIEALEALAASDELPGATRLWSGEEGEALARFFEEFLAHADTLASIDPAHYPALLEAGLAQRVTRPRYGTHPRLSILGPLEARLHHADVTILGGLNEGVWPQEPGADPWLSRPMKTQLNLPQPERRAGLAAHDFVQGASAPVVYLTRAERVGETPTIPSRWLLRLDALIGANLWPAAPQLGWQSEMDRPSPGEHPVETAPPAPRPPVEARPTRLSVTEVETWRSNPYGLYAKHILGLKPLEPVDADPGARERGVFLHGVLERFLKQMPVMGDDALDTLLKIGAEAFAEFDDTPGIHAVWWPRFKRIAAWFVEVQRQREGQYQPVLLEGKGRIALEESGFELTARADRIDRRADGTYEIIDYKTGETAKPRQLRAGYKPQLALEGLIAQRGGFDGLPAGVVGELAYWKLQSGATESRLEEVQGQKNIPVAELIDQAEAGLRAMIAAFADQDTPYLAHPNPLERGWGDYDHLARVRAWGDAGDDN